MAETSDLAVVGGGPAGLATAIEARLANLRVVLVERRRPPMDLACGEGLMPTGVDDLRRLGVEIPKNECREFCGVSYHDDGITARASFHCGRGLGIRRPVLHQALIDRAAALGADLRWGVAATGIDDDLIETDAGAIRARSLVAADGRLSRLRSWAGIETSTGKRPRFGIRRHYAVAPWSDRVEVHWADAAEAYVTPVGQELIGVAVLSAVKPLELDDLLLSFPRLVRRLDGAPVATRDRGAGPFGHRPAEVVRGRLALVGDASGCLDPITGEGLSVAFRQARAVVAAIRQGSLESYRGAHRRLMRLPRRLTALLLVAERHPGVRRVVVRTLAAQPRLFSRLVDLVGCSRPAAPGQS